VPPGSLAAGIVTLSGQEGHHAATVRRLRPGERADVSDGAGTLAESVVRDVGRDCVVLAVRSVRAVPSPRPRVTVVQALPKGDRGELAVELMTEVGVDRVVPWAAERCVARWQGERGAKSLGKWRGVAREASKQSRRAWLPEVTAQETLAGVGRLVRAARCAVLLAADADTTLSGLALPESGEILLIVGPEGGISAAERRALSAAGAVEARLGPTVLRTSTAGAAATAVLLSRCGRWLPRSLVYGVPAVPAEADVSPADAVPGVDAALDVDAAPGVDPSLACGVTAEPVLPAVVPFPCWESGGDVAGLVGDVGVGLGAGSVGDGDIAGGEGACAADATTAGADGVAVRDGAGAFGEADVGHLAAGPSSAADSAAADAEAVGLDQADDVGWHGASVPGDEELLVRPLVP
jgi:16S rRNA (uracil1498-N3)-methyltransferase